MKRVVICMNILFFALLTIGIVSPAFADFKYEWKVEEFEKEAYVDIYLYRLDLRNLLVETYDEEDGTATLEGLDQGVIDDIVSLFHRNFTGKLKEIMILNDSQEIDRTKESLVAEFSLSAKFTHDDPGVLTKMLINPKQEPSKINFTVIVKEAKTDKMVIEINDTKEIQLKDPGNPLNNEGDFQEFTELVEFWSRSFALILKEGKK